MLNGTRNDAAKQAKPLQFNLRDLGFVVTIAGLIFALIFTQYQTRTRLQSRIDELELRINRSEESHDKRERQLIGQLSPGDQISQHPDFLILADYEIDETHELRIPFLQYYYKCENCSDYRDHAIYVFSLEFDRIEGVNEFYIVVVDGQIDRIITGEAVNS